MKKSRLIFFLLLISIIYQIGTVNSQSSVGTGLNLIDTASPIINLIFPLNNSGVLSENVTFFYNVSDASKVDNCSVVINNVVNTTNKSTMVKDATLTLRMENLSLGLKTWSVNCTDNLSNMAESAFRVLSVNLLATSKFNGTVTNLSSVNITNVTNFVVGVSTVGKINFSEGINLSGGFDLDKYINISFNRIELNSTALVALNKSATLQLEGLSFSNPRIAKDGVVCPDSICKKVSYSGGVLVFNVTHFTSYSAEETPDSGDSGSSGSSGGASGGGGGGSGGGGSGGGGLSIGDSAETKKLTDFSVSRNLVKVSLQPDSNAKETLKIENTGEKALELQITVKNIENFLSLPTDELVSFRLEPGEKKELHLNFNAPYNQQPGIYTGKVLVISEGMQKIIDVIIEVESIAPIFDIDVEVLPQYQKVFPGDEVIAEIKVFNLRGSGRVDISVDYSIWDIDGESIVEEHETVAVDTQTSLTRSIRLPTNSNPGSYIFYTKVAYDGTVGSASDIFEIIERPKFNVLSSGLFNTTLIAVGIIFILIIFFFILHMERSHLHTQNAELSNKIAKREADTKPKMPSAEQKKTKPKGMTKSERKLKKGLKILEADFQSGLISYEEYKRRKEKLENKFT